MTGEPKDGQRWVNYPFPLNPAFPSPPVVSDGLANEVYSRVVQGGKSVRMVSAELNVSLQRVAAIVRLKTIEERWMNEVCSSYSTPHSMSTRDLYDEPTRKKSISLEDFYMVKQNTAFFLRVTL